MTVRVTYGNPEPDPTADLRYRGTVSRWGAVSLYPERPLRRKKFETWIENGKKMGRWTWESYT